MDDHPRSRSLIWTLVGWAITIVALGFIVRWIHGLGPEVWTTIRTLDPGWLAVAIGLFGVWFGLRFLAWDRICRLNGYVGNRSQNLRMWTLSEFARYVPGNVWSFVARYRGSRTAGIERNASAGMLATEALGLVAGAGFVACLTLPIGRYLVVSFVATLAAVIALRYLPRLIGRGRPGVTIRRPGLFELIVRYGLVWAVYGLATAAVWRAFPVHGSLGVMIVIGANVGAWLAGYLSFVTPMGLGVREVAFVAILSTTLDSSLAGLVAIVTRLWMIVAELVFVAVILCLRRPLQRSEVKT